MSIYIDGIPTNTAIGAINFTKLERLKFGSIGWIGWEMLIPRMKWDWEDKIVIVVKQTDTGPYTIVNYDFDLHQELIKNETFITFCISTENNKRQSTDNTTDNN
jgi:hypothetical protein